MLVGKFCGLTRGHEPPRPNIETRKKRVAADRSATSQKETGRQAPFGRIGQGQYDQKRSKMEERSSLGPQEGGALKKRQRTETRACPRGVQGHHEREIESANDRGWQEKEKIRKGPREHVKTFGNFNGGGGTIEGKVSRKGILWKIKLETWDT